jgi:hypothetical protein
MGNMGAGAPMQQDPHGSSQPFNMMGQQNQSYSNAGSYPDMQNYNPGSAAPYGYPTNPPASSYDPNYSNTYNTSSTSYGSSNHNAPASHYGGSGNYYPSTGGSVNGQQGNYENNSMESYYPPGPGTNQENGYQNSASGSGTPYWQQHGNHGYYHGGNGNTNQYYGGSGGGSYGSTNNGETGESSYYMGHHPHTHEQGQYGDYGSREQGNMYHGMNSSGFMSEMGQNSIGSPRNSGLGGMGGNSQNQSSSMLNLQQNSNVNSNMQNQNSATMGNLQTSQNPSMNNMQSSLGSQHTSIGSQNPMTNQNTIGSSQNAMNSLQTSVGGTLVGKTQNSQNSIGTQNPMGAPHSPIGNLQNTSGQQQNSVGSQSPMRPSQNTVGNQIPMGSQQHSVGTSQTVTGNQQNSAGPPQNSMINPHNPMGIQQNPMESTHNSVGASQNPVGTPQQLIGTQQNSMGTLHNPMGTPQNSMVNSQNPMGNTQNLMGTPNALITPQNPMGVTQNPVGSSQNQLGMSQNLLGTTQNIIGTSQNPMGPPQNSVGTPQNSVGTPEDSLAASQSSIGTSQNPMGASQAAMGNQQNPMGISQNPMGAQQNSLGALQHPVAPPQNVMGMPQNPMGSQQNVMGISPNPVGTTQNSRGTSQSSLSTQQNVLGTSKNPVTTPNTMEGSQNPMGATQDSAGNSQNPLNSLQSTAGNNSQNTLNAMQNAHNHMHGHPEMGGNASNPMHDTYGRMSAVEPNNCNQSTCYGMGNDVSSFHHQQALQNSSNRPCLQQGSSSCGPGSNNLYGSMPGNVQYLGENMGSISVCKTEAGSHSSINSMMTVDGSSTGPGSRGNTELPLYGPPSGGIPYSNRWNDSLAGGGFSSASQQPEESKGKCEGNVREESRSMSTGGSSLIANKEKLKFGEENKCHEQKNSSSSVDGSGQMTCENRQLSRDGYCSNSNSVKCLNDVKPVISGTNNEQDGKSNTVSPCNIQQSGNIMCGNPPPPSLKAEDKISINCSNETQTDVPTISTKNYGSLNIKSDISGLSDMSAQHNAFKMESGSFKSDSHSQMERMKGFERSSSPHFQDKETKDLKEYELSNENKDRKPSDSVDGRRCESLAVESKDASCGTQNFDCPKDLNLNEGKQLVELGPGAARNIGSREDPGIPYDWVSNRMF